MAVSRVVNSDSFQVTTPSDREIRMTRLFDAPRALVFDSVEDLHARGLGMLGVSAPDRM